MRATCAPESSVVEATANLTRTKDRAILFHRVDVKFEKEIHKSTATCMIVVSHFRAAPRQRSPQSPCNGSHRHAGIVLGTAFIFQDVKWRNIDTCKHPGK
jgi:hypothetical protein